MNCRLCHPKPLGDNKKKKAKKKSWKGRPNSQSCSFSTDITPPVEQAKAKGGRAELAEYAQGYRGPMGVNKITDFRT